MRKCYRCKMTADGPKAGQRGAAGDGPIKSNCSHLPCFLKLFLNIFSSSLLTATTTTPPPQAKCCLNTCRVSQQNVLIE